jgi:hypothetical protein
LSNRAYKILGVLHKGPGSFRRDRSVIGLSDFEIARRARPGKPLSVATVQRALRELEQAELVKRHGTGGERTIERLYVATGGNKFDKSANQICSRVPVSLLDREFKERPTTDGDDDVVSIPDQVTSTSPEPPPAPTPPPIAVEPARIAPDPPAADLADPIAVAAAVIQEVARDAGAAADAGAVAAVARELLPKRADEVSVPRVERRVQGELARPLQPAVFQALLVLALFAFRANRKPITHPVGWLAATIRDWAHNGVAPEATAAARRFVESRVKQRAAAAALALAKARSAPEPELAPPTPEDIERATRWLRSRITWQVKIARETLRAAGLDAEVEAAQPARPAEFITS